MKQFFFGGLVFCMMLGSGSLTSCKNKNKDKSTETTNAPATTDQTPTPPPPTINSDEQLRQGLQDALKDYPTVQGSVQDSVIVLTGSIERARWQQLNPTLNSLRPKRVDPSKLTIK